MRVHENAKLPVSALRISIADMIALGVRTTGADPPSPRLLYQELPESAMTLMATVPRGAPAVSILQQNGVYPILKAAPSGTSGILIVYARKPSNRYQAVEVLYGGRSFTVDQFLEFAEHWIDKSMGGLKASGDRHAYFAPSRGQWEVILRDEGYTTVDPSQMVFDVDTGILGRRKDITSSGVIARVSVQTGSGSREGEFFATFERVELTLDPDPDSTVQWVDFSTFQRTRAIQSRPPGQIVPAFREWVQLLATESGFKFFLFRRGMFCGDRIEWWGHANVRRTRHEGIDFAEGPAADEYARNIPEGTPVRAMAAGDNVAVLDDYLNKTVVIRHPSIQNETGAVLHTLFSHIHPAVQPPAAVSKGQILGNVGKAKKVGAPAHLHLSGAWIPSSIDSAELTMDLIHPAFTPVVLINFNSLLTSG